VFLDKQPSNVGEEKSASRIVRICVSFREFVVYAVITGPAIDATLVGNRVTKH
jgi:hypothetical protein